MTIKEIREMPISELQKNIAEQKEALFNLRFQHSINQLDNPMQISKVKKDIARVSTVLRQIELESAEA